MTKEILFAQACSRRYNIAIEILTLAWAFCKYILFVSNLYKIGKFTYNIYYKYNKNSHRLNYVKFLP